MLATHRPLVPFSYRKFPYSQSRALVPVSRLSPSPHGTVNAEAPPMAWVWRDSERSGDSEEEDGGDSASFSNQRVLISCKYQNCLEGESTV